MNIAAEMTTTGGSEVVDDLVEVHFGRPTVEAWLETMWGVTPGKSSPVCHATAVDLPPWTALWLHRLWGLASLPDGTALRESTVRVGG